MRLISATLAVKPTQLVMRMLGLAAYYDDQDTVLSLWHGDDINEHDLDDHAADCISQHLTTTTHEDVSTSERGTVEDDPTQKSTIADSMLEKINITAIKGQATWPPFYSANDPLNFCGDSTEHHTNNTGPTVADCTALRGIVDYAPGYWDVTANAGDNGYILITSHGTCGFVVKPWNSAADLL